MKPKLTKAQLAKAKRAVVRELRDMAHLWFDDDDATLAEAQRLLRVALRAVRGA